MLQAGWHDAIRKYFPSHPHVDSFFQQVIQDLPVPQPRDYWVNFEAGLLAKPTFKMFPMHTIGNWKSYFESLRQEQLADSAQQLAQSDTPEHQLFGQVGQAVAEAHDVAAQDVAASAQYDAHYREYLDNGWATAAGLGFAAENNIDMSSLPGNPPYSADQIQAAFRDGECEPLVPVGL